MDKQIIPQGLITSLREFVLIHQSDRFNEIQDENFKNLVVESSNAYHHFITLVATNQAVIK